MPDEENGQIGSFDGQIDQLGAFSADYLTSDGEPFGPGKPNRIVVRAKRLPRPYGGMSHMPIMLSVAVPADLFGIASIAAIPPDNLCGTFPNSQGRQVIITFNPDGSGYYIAPPNFDISSVLRDAEAIRNQHFINLNSPATSSMAGAMLLAAFALRVRPSGVYDWKESGSNNTLVNIPGAPANADGSFPKMRVYEPFGNWAYGFFGAALGLDDEALLGGAHLAQLIGSGHMDDPRDQANAAAGAAAFREQYSNAVNSQTGKPLPASYFAIIQC